MIGRVVTLAAGLSGAAGFSQFPEFSQQYAQRLGGAVDELRRVVDEFDRDAAAVGLTRDVALQDLAKGGAIGAERSRTMAATIDRHGQLVADLDALRGVGPFTRARNMMHLNDPEIARRTWEVYKPALPLTFEGAAFAGVGFATLAMIGAALVALPRRVLRRPRKRRRGNLSA